MSVIFQAIQKMDNGDGEAATTEGIHAAQPADDSAAKANLLRRYAVIAAAVLIIMVLGFGAVYGVRTLGGRLPRGSERQTASARYAISANHSEPSDDTGRSSPSPLAQNQPQARYIPPEPDQEITSHPAQAATPDSMPGTGPVSEDKSTDRLKLPGTSESRGAAPPVLLSEQITGYGRQGDQDVQETSAAPLPSVAIKSEAEVAWEQAEARRRADFEKRAHISQLVRQIELSIHNGHKTDAQMKALIELKGADSDFVIKLKAFQLVKAGAYSQAETLLRKLLAVNETDLEAGYNLAVIELKTGRSAQARKRLLQLREFYPGDARIADSLRKLK
jgi:hypothetical protein